MKALVKGHPRVPKKVFVTGAGRLRECENTEFVWELSKTGFCKGGRKKSCPLRECPLGELTLYLKEAIRN